MFQDILVVGAMHLAIKSLSVKYKTKFTRIGVNGHGLIYDTEEIDLPVENVTTSVLKEPLQYDSALIDQENYPLFEPAEKWEIELMILLHNRCEDILRHLEDRNRRLAFIKSIDQADGTQLSQDLAILYKTIKSAYEAGREDQAQEMAETAQQTAILNRAKGKAVSKANSDTKAIELAPFIDELHKQGVQTLQGIADALNQAGMTTKTGHGWYPSTVKLLLKRIDTLHSNSAQIER